MAKIDLSSFDIRGTNLSRANLQGAFLSKVDKGQTSRMRISPTPPQTFYRWRQKFGGMTVPNAQRLRELEKEHARLKRLLAERDLEVDALKVLLVKKA